ncbi:MAG TPA: family 10 glycosylhydrolase [Ktedonobacteraceae bacterium]|nr:family 10 glycosylhydrolase [Ktedonobacteraceae bacterium]
MQYSSYDQERMQDARRVRMLSCVVAAAVMLLMVETAFAWVVTPARASNPSNSAQHQMSTTPTQQFRAAWIATITNTDWPFASGLPVAQQKQQFIQLLDGMQQMHMNAAVVQVRPTADAFYPSKYAPWSQYLTGVQGKNPGYDPLAYMLQQTHTRGMQFHAWFNPFRVSLHDQLSQLAPNSPARQHPDWVVTYGGQLYFNPGIPAARNYIIQSILEVVRNYNIDAVHLDDYFYPYRIAGQTFPDQATYQKYGARKFSNISDWRRDNVNQFMHTLYNGIKRIKSQVQLGVSPFGVWRNKTVDSSGSDTHAGQTDYDDLYADTRAWIRNHWIDYIVPQIYWNIGFAAADYAKLVPWWAKEVQGKNVKLYIGQAAYKINATPGPWSNPNEIPNQLKYNLQFPAVKGGIFFSISSLQKNPLGIKDYLSSHSYKAPTPVISRPQATRSNITGSA